MCKVNSMQNPPKREGDYLFYFGEARRPFFSVDTLRFTVEEDDYETRQWYLENSIREPTLWFELPEIGKGEG